MKSRKIGLVALSSSLAFAVACGGDDAATTAETTATSLTTNIPSLSIEIPDSLQNGDSGSDSSRVAARSATGVSKGIVREYEVTAQAAPEEVDPSQGAQSYGLSQLERIAQDIKNNITDTNKHIQIIDAKQPEMDAYCGGVTCDIPAGTLEPVTFTAEQIAAQQAEVENHFPPEDQRSAQDEAELDRIKEEIAGHTEMEIPALTYEVLNTDSICAADYSGTQLYENRVSFSETHEMGSFSMSISWGCDQNITFTETFDDTQGESSGGSGKRQFTSNGTTTTVANEFSMSNDTFKDNISLTVTDEATNAVTINATIKGEGTYSFNEKISGFVDDNGGYVETEHTYDEYDITVGNASGLSDDSQYIMVRQGLDIDNEGWKIWEFAIGEIYTWGGEDQAFIWQGGLTLNTALTCGTDFDLYNVVFDPNSWENGPTITAVSSCTVTVTPTSVTEYTYNYKELFDAEGNVTNMCFKDAWTGGEYQCQNGAMQGEYVEDFGDHDFKELSVSGNSEGQDYIIVRAGQTPGGTNGMCMNFEAHIGNIWSDGWVDFWGVLSEGYDIYPMTWNTEADANGCWESFGDQASGITISE